MGLFSSIIPDFFSGGAAGAASLLGGVLGNQASAREAQKSRDWQTDMSNSAYQRATQDMRAAGLNPMLAYKQGGASTPSGATAQQSDVLTPAVNTAQAARRLHAEIKNLQEQNENIRSSTAANEAQARNYDSQSALNKVMAAKGVYDAQQSATNAKLLDYSLPAAETESAIEQSFYGKGVRWSRPGLGLLADIINPFKGSAKALSRMGSGSVPHLRSRKKPAAPAAQSNLTPSQSRALAQKRAKYNQ